MVECIILGAFLAFMCAKNYITLKNRIIIYKAIRNYYRNCAYSDLHNIEKTMEPYEKTLLRFWDWGYENILPEHEFEFIKPYLNMDKTQK